MIVFDYLTAPQNNSTVIIAAGPSTAINKDKISQYIQQNNSIVFAANYNYEQFGIKSNFTYFTDIRKLREQIKNINSDIIVRGFTYADNKKEVKKLLSKFKKKAYLIGALRANGTYKNYSIYGNTKIEIGKNGHYKYWTIGASGFGAVLVSLMCRPKKILISGIDGPEPGQMNKKTFDGKTVKSDGPKKDKKIIKYFKSCLFPQLKKMNIQIETFDSVRLYNLDKIQLGVTVI